MKKTCKFTIPGVFMVNTCKKPATKSEKRVLFGKVIVVNTKPAKTVVNAFAVMALKTAIWGPPVFGAGGLALMGDPRGRTSGKSQRLARSELRVS